MQGIFAIRNKNTHQEKILYTRNHNKYWQAILERVAKPEARDDEPLIVDMRKHPRGTFDIYLLEQIDGSAATISNTHLQDRKDYWIAKRNPQYNSNKERRTAKTFTIESLESRITLLEEQVQTLLKTIQG